METSIAWKPVEDETFICYYNGVVWQKSKVALSLTSRKKKKKETTMSHLKQFDA